MSRTIKCGTTSPDEALLTIEQLEEGLRLLQRGDVDQNAFWDANVDAFRQTVLVAIHDTSEALLSAGIPMRWALELEDQLKALVRYIDLADDYIARRSVSRGLPTPAFEPSLSRIH